MLGLDLNRLKETIRDTPTYHKAGRLRSATGLLTSQISAAVGDQCSIVGSDGTQILAEVIGFSERTAYLLPYERADALRPGLPVIPRGRRVTVPSGSGLLGRVVDGLGRPLDGRGPLPDGPRVSVNSPSPAALSRARIREPFVTGQRAIDGLLTCGRGQRVGIFAGSGVGKSTLLGEIAKGADCDVNVVALIGERGREVGPFLEDCLGPEGLARSVVVLATCDQTPLMRVRATQAAIAVADHFRSEGANVLLMVDSLTRLAMAQREIGLMLGEPPSARGYPPSVFQLLADVVERLGNAEVGGITALLTVLVDGDDTEEPISDAARSLLDGHVVLDRKIAERGIYPAIGIARSVSRVAREVVDAEHSDSARKLRAVLATYMDSQDLIRLGMYRPGADPRTDKAIELMPQVEQFLRQGIGQRSGMAETRAALVRIASAWPW